MVRKIPTIQYLCPRCKKVFSGYTKFQVWFQYSTHTHTSHLMEEGELVQQCQKKLGISDEELQISRPKYAKQRNNY